MYKKITYSVLTLVIMAGMVPTVFATANTPKSGINYVPVDSCVQNPNGISIGKFGKTPYFLSNGIRDAGYGLRNYTLTCMSATQYKVEWIDYIPQPRLASVSAFSNTTSDLTPHFLTLQNASYTDAKAYFGLPQPIMVKNNVQKLTFRATPGSLTTPGLTYGFVWNTDTKSSFIFDQASVTSNATIVTMSSKNTMDLNVTDFYRGKYMVLYVFVSNNDGTSAVPNMPIEVDDVIPVYLQFEKLPVLIPVPLPQLCGNSTGGDGLYSACVGYSITHTAPIRITVANYTDSYAVLAIRGANELQISVAKGGYHLVKSNSGKYLKISYIKTSETYGAFIQITEVELM